MESIGKCLIENKLQNQDHEVRMTDELKEGRMMKAKQGTRQQSNKNKYF